MDVCKGIHHLDAKHKSINLVVSGNPFEVGSGSVFSVPRYSVTLNKLFIITFVAGHISCEAC